jgi:hypothetical protein
MPLFYARRCPQVLAVARLYFEDERMSDSIAPSEIEGRKVLRTQNQTRADKEMSPVPPPIQDETVALASGGEAHGQGGDHRG